MSPFDPQELLAPLPPPPGWNPWEELANAVVRQAAEDWREAVHTLLHPPGRPGAVRNRQIREAADMLRDCERFFRSRWIRILTGEDGTKILEQLRREMIDHMDAREYLGLAVRLDGEIDGKLAELSSFRACTSWYSARRRGRRAAGPCRSSWSSRRRSAGRSTNWWN